MLRCEDLNNGLVVMATIDRPQRRNALNLETIRALTAALDDAVARKVRCFVVTGAGGYFSAGADLTGVESDEFGTALRAALSRLRDAPFVTMAAIDGVAFGAGVQLAGFSDLRMATSAARFAVPAARLGLAVDVATIERVVELCGGGAARHLLLGDGEVSADDAHRLGFVQRLGSLDDALEWAGVIASRAPLTIQAHKAALRACSPVAPSDAAALAAAAVARTWASSDAVEGRTAFLEKRPAHFRGE